MWHRKTRKWWSNSYFPHSCQHRWFARELIRDIARFNFTIKPHQVFFTFKRTLKSLFLLFNLKLQNTVLIFIFGFTCCLSEYFQIWLLPEAVYYSKWIEPWFKSSILCYWSRTSHLKKLFSRCVVSDQESITWKPHSYNRTITWQISQQTLTNEDQSCHHHHEQLLHAFWNCCLINWSCSWLAYQPLENLKLATQCKAFPIPKELPQLSGWLTRCKN